MVLLLASAGRTFGAGATRPADVSGPPNIVFILADDLGWSELGCYGNTYNETPNLDRLAARGLRFTCAYSSSPVCSPTRAALMTGQHPARVGITDYLRGDDKRFLAADYHTLAEALHDAGYATGLIGKWHLMGDYAQRRGDPAGHGFDEVICSETRYIAEGDYFGPYKFMPDVQPRTADEYLTDRLTQETLSFIYRHRARPFFLYLSHYAVHAFLAGKPEEVARFRAKPGAGQPGRNPELAAMLASVDEGVGRIASALEDWGLADRTLLIFTSDNGGELRFTTNRPLRSGKATLYEGGIRVPLIIDGAGFTRTGEVCDVPVTALDFYPTFLEIAGAKPKPQQTLDGQSIVPLLRGATTLSRETLYWDFTLDRPERRRSASAIRRGDYKLIEYHDTRTDELYDLGRDPSEEHDLAGEMPEKRTELAGALKQWRREVTRGAATRPSDR
ncbi:MAG: sulfatase [Planctomycetes bacterium]|nr:sulfatase [Planctomycetota bacterium]